MAAAIRRFLCRRRRAIQHAKPVAQPPASHDLRILHGLWLGLRDPVFEWAPGNFWPILRQSVESAFRATAGFHYRGDGILGGRRPRGLLPAAGPARQLDLPRDAVPRGAAVPQRPPPRAFRPVRGARVADFGGGALLALSLEACRGP